MTLEGIHNPRLKGAYTREEFKKSYMSYIIAFSKKIAITKDREFLVDDKVDRDSIISYLYNEYLEAYKYDEDDYKEWLERRNK